MTDLAAAIASHEASGYRLDMIMPGDDPTTASLSRPSDGAAVTLTGTSSVGRAGMEYRDLIPDRLGGRVIASHIRIPDGGPVPDSVHFHDVGFQVIVCRAGWVRVVYEDQGPPFVLSPGDVVLQPPGIRHRVLEASPGLEVVELATPASHPTRFDHDLALPTSGAPQPDRVYGAGQRFVRSIAEAAPWTSCEIDGWQSRDTAISSATDGLASVRHLRPTAGTWTPTAAVTFLYVTSGSVDLSGSALESDGCVVLPPGIPVHLTPTPDTELLHISIDIAPNR